MSALGCSQHTGYIQDKCSGPRLCELTNATRIYYDRRLDDISEAEVTVAIPGDVLNSCCDCLGDAEPWCHILTIVREGDGVVWTGPIIEMDYGVNDVIIRAKDKLAWLTKRVNETEVSNPPGSTNSLTNLAVDIIEQAMFDDGDSPCFTPDNGGCIINNGDGLAADADRGRTFLGFSGPTAYDNLVSLAESGIDFTVVNQCLILGGEQLPDEPIGVLTDEMILGDVRVRKDGNHYFNRFYVRFDGDDDCDPEGTCNNQPSPVCPCPPFAEVDEKFCYGLIERVIDELSSELQAPEDAQVVADLYASTQGNIVPRFIDFPSDTRLSSDVPWEMNAMIPGQRIDVALSNFCFEVFQSFRLQKVTVDDTPEGEEIKIDLGVIQTTDIFD